MGGLFSLFGGKDAPAWQDSVYDLNMAGRIGSAKTSINDLGLALSGYDRALGMTESQRSYIGGLKQDAIRQQQMKLSGLAIGGDQARAMGLAGGAGWQTSGLLGAAQRKNELQMAMDKGLQMDTSGYDMAAINAAYQSEGIAQGYLGQLLAGRAQETQFGLQKAMKVSELGQQMAQFNTQGSYSQKMADWQNKQSFMNSMVGGLFGLGGSLLGGWASTWGSNDDDEEGPR